MEVKQDDLCFILDLEGFFINKTLHAREVGYYTWNTDAFHILMPYQELNDKRTVNFVIKMIQGLRYQPTPAEPVQRLR